MRGEGILMSTRGRRCGLKSFIEISIQIMLGGKKRKGGGNRSLKLLLGELV